MLSCGTLFCVCQNLSFWLICVCFVSQNRSREWYSAHELHKYQVGMFPSLWKEQKKKGLFHYLRPSCSKHFWKVINMLLLKHKMTVSHLVCGTKLSFILLWLVVILHKNVWRFSCVSGALSRLSLWNPHQNLLIVLNNHCRLRLDDVTPPLFISSFDHTFSVHA